MKKTLLLLLPIYLFSQSFLISSIPLPKVYVQDLDPYKCDETCIQELIDNQRIFSFLAHAHKKLPNAQQDKVRVMHISILNLGMHTPGEGLRIAMLLPYKKIGKYASSTTNAAFAYLITKEHPFELKSYNINSEDVEDLQLALNAIKNDGFNYVIAPLTQQGADNLASLNPDVNIYFPTINKRDTNATSAYLFYGGIDYQAQSDLLIQEASSPLVIFYDKSKLGKKLALYEEDKFKYALLPIGETLNRSFLPQDDNNKLMYNQQIMHKVRIEDNQVIRYSISRRRTNLEPYLKDNEKIYNGSFFLNTPIVKSGMIMSQLTLYDVNATNILSTQINYDPLLLSMTQYSDRKQMIIANSITLNDDILTETNALLGNDIVYDWINYTTTIGIDYFYSLITNEKRNYQIPIVNNQIKYPIELKRPSLSRFVTYYQRDNYLNP